MISYLAPEYAQSGKLTDKSDVYSFGVVLLELITGHKAVDSNRPQGDESLVEWVRLIVWPFWALSCSMMFSFGYIYFYHPNFPLLVMFFWCRIFLIREWIDMLFLWWCVWLHIYWLDFFLRLYDVYRLARIFSGSLEMVS